MIIKIINWLIIRYGSIERFANYSIEGRVCCNKKTVSSASSGYGRENSQHSITCQELAKSFREDTYRLEEGHQPGKKRKYDAWTEVILQGIPEPDFPQPPKKTKVDPKYTPEYTRVRIIEL